MAPTPPTPEAVEFKPHSRSHRPVKIVVYAAMVAGGIALTALAGWLFDVEVFKRVLDGRIAMNPATAVAFVAGAAWLFVFVRARVERSRVATGTLWALAGFVVTCGALKLIETIGGVGIGFDRWLFASKLADDIVPNRMAPNTAFSFVLVGVAMLLTTGGRRRAAVAAQLISLAASIIAMLALIGYAYGVGFLYGVASLIPMAANTALSFVALAIGVLWTRPEQGVMTVMVNHGPGGILARRLIPIVIVVPAVLGWATLAGQRAGWFDSEFGHGLLVMCVVVLLLILVWWTGGVLYRGDLVRRSAEAETDRLARIVANTEDAIFSEDLDGRVTSWNAGACRMFGYEADQIIGRPASILVPPDRMAASTELLEPVLEGDEIERHRTVRITRDGVRLDVSMTVSPILDDTGEVVGMASIVRDIRATVAAERAMVEAKEAAETASRVKSQFLANMSHEIRTPMAAIAGYTDLLMDPEPSPGDPAEYIHAIRQNVDHLLSVINDILDLSKIEAGEMAVERIECKPCHILADVASVMRVRAAKSKLDFEVEHEAPIPLTVQTDPTRLRQILINLAGNAAKFTKRGRVRVSMELTHENAEAPLRLTFTVRDTGIGMDEQTLSGLFRPFNQGDSSITRRFGGTGLGLTISRHLARMLGGDITVVSEPGVGSTFTLHIDPGSLAGVRMLQHCSEAMTEDEQERYHWPRTRVSGRILLVDDGIHNRNVLSIYLGHAGAEVSLAENGEAGCAMAIQAVETGRPFDLILMDMQMPVLDGYAATRRLRRLGFEGPIIALTAHAMAGDREKCLDAGCTDYLSKPVSRHDLVAAVGRHLSGADEDAALAVESDETTGEVPELPLVSDAAADELDDEISRFLPMFKAQLAEWITEIEGQLRRGDRAMLASVLHNVKGAGGLYGYEEISSRASELLGRVHEIDDLADLGDPIDDLLASIRAVDGTGD